MLSHRFHVELSKSSEHLVPFYCFLVGLPEHWLERQRKVQERIERVQRENEVQANRGAWKLRGPTRVTKNRGSQRNQKKFLRPLALLLESNACNGPLISKGLFPSQKISTFRCCLRLYFRLSAACVLMWDNLWTPYIIMRMFFFFGWKLWECSELKTDSQFHVWLFLIGLHSWWRERGRGWCFAFPNSHKLVCFMH